MLRSEPAWVAALRQFLIRLDTFMAAAALLLLLLLVFGQVVLRNLFSTGIPSAELLARYLVLYITFFGAALAIEQRRHIRIDVVAALFDHAWIRRLLPPLYLLSALVCVWLAQSALNFWYDDWLYVSAAERWTSVLALITPGGFCLLAVHFLLGALFAPAEPATP